jgi:hypothetical protein
LKINKIFYNNIQRSALALDKEKADYLEFLALQEKHLK